MALLRGAETKQKGETDHGKGAGDSKMANGVGRSPVKNGAANGVAVNGVQHGGLKNGSPGVCNGKVNGHIPSAPAKKIYGAPTRQV